MKNINNKDCASKSEFVELAYKEYYRKTANLIYRMSKDKELSDDIASRTFLRLLEIDDWRSIQNLRSFIYVVAKNFYFDHQKTNATKIKNQPLIYCCYQTENIEADHFKNNPDALDWAPFYFFNDSSPEEELMKDELRDVLRRALDDLTGRPREIYSLFRNGSFYAYEIADITSLTVSSIEKHISKAKKALSDSVEWYACDSRD